MSPVKCFRFSSTGFPDSSASFKTSTKVGYSVKHKLHDLNNVSACGLGKIPPFIQADWTSIHIILGSLGWGRVNETQVPLSGLFTSFPLSHATPRRRGVKCLCANLSVHSSPQYFTPACGEGWGRGRREPLTSSGRTSKNTPDIMSNLRGKLKPAGGEEEGG